MNGKCGEEILPEKNINTPMKNLLKISSNIQRRDSSKGENLQLKTRTNNKISSVDIGHSTAYNQCFSQSNFPPQYEEECPVNYSLKYSETELPKAVEKTENSKENFKSFVDYVETDLDQPTNFSLKYAEKTCDEEIKESDFTYFDNSKRKFKRYVEYAETDLDQPTDFTLKYREGVDEDAGVKNPGFHFYENNKPKISDCYAVQAENEDVPNNRVADNFVCEDETPLMFSRCSSLNSLSSFVHIGQSIPDDRSSVVSDFSRMTSGIISPSELPDSPTQTAPSSPKRVKVPNCFTAKPDFLLKKSVFEDDVATYKQEDTPVEFSRATSLSSLNADNSVKSECILKVHLKPPSLNGSKDKNHISLDQTCPEHLRDQPSVTQKVEHDKEKFEIPIVMKGHDNLFNDRVRAGNQTNRNSHSDCNQLLRKNNSGFMTPEGSKTTRLNPDFALKSNSENKFQSDAEKTFPVFEVADDVVHTYYTEGTPANISHAASHSNLSTLSMVSGAPSSGIHDNSDDGSFHSEDSEHLSLKTQPHKDAVEGLDMINKKLSIENKRISMPPGQNVFLSNQPQFDYLRKDNQLTAKDETATFATENSPCDFSVRSSFSDLTISIIDTPLCLNRTEVCEEPPSQMFTPLHNVSPQSPSSVNLNEMEDLEKITEDEKIIEDKEKFWSSEAIDNVPAEPDTVEENIKNYSEEVTSGCGRPGSPISREENFDLYSREPLTPYEEALLEQCIRLGMPQKKKSGGLKENECPVAAEEKKSGQKESKFLVNKSNSKAVSQKLKHPGMGITKKGSKETTVNGDSFDFDSSEPLSVFEEALIEQCIRSGMPQKRNTKKLGRSNAKNINNYEEEFINEPSEHITPLEAALLEYCIRLGMPPRRTPKNQGENNMKADFNDESTKVISSLSSQLNRLKINSDCEKDLSRKTDHFVCNCGKKNSSRQKSSCCRRAKTFKE